MKASELNFLVVEDDESQRGMIVKMLRALGATSVREAGDGKQALEVLHAGQGQPQDIIICDMNMPEMDGMEFLRHLGQEKFTHSIIILSALDRALLTSVEKMSEGYGITLLGVAAKPISRTQLEALLARYRRAEINPQPPRAAVRVFSLEDILHGIGAQQFEPFFQPKVDLKTGKVTGAEALARWRHPQHGLVAPYAFIALLERADKMDELTFMMLRRSAAACRILHEKGYPLTVSVNLSLTSLADTTLADRITRVVRDAGVDPQYIVLEVTESAAMTDVAPALENLARLRMHGFGLSIDDYGTGYASMQQITRIAFSELKIDQSFVKDFTDHPAMRIIVESSIDMARKLQVKSVAEGVETQQDWDTLKSIGCDTAQGYFIARPMDPVAFHDFLASYRPIATSPAAMQERGKIHVLVIEDDEFTRKMILRVLRDLGYTDLTDTDSAEAALQLFEADAFGLIITDCQMGGMNGLEFVKLIRSGKTRALPNTRIVVLTAFSKTEVLGVALALDVNGFLVKPIVPAELENKLTNAMSERVHLRPPIAYASINTELTGQPISAQPAGRHAPSITLDRSTTRPLNAHERQLTLGELRPGMTLAADIRFSDGNKLLSSGYTLTESSINRLKDMEALLQSKNMVVRENVLQG